jgi:hypothetical protein
MEKVKYKLTDDFLNKFADCHNAVLKGNSYNDRFEFALIIDKKTWRKRKLYSEFLEGLFGKLTSKEMLERKTFHCNGEIVKVYEIDSETEVFEIYLKKII